jgi:hypothetical protein
MGKYTKPGFSVHDVVIQAQVDSKPVQWTKLKPKPSLADLWRFWLLHVKAAFPKYVNVAADSKAMGQLKLIRDKIGIDTPRALQLTATDWVAFCKYVYGQTGKSMFPDYPNIGYLLSQLDYVIPWLQTLVFTHGSQGEKAHDKATGTEQPAPIGTVVGKDFFA